MSSTTQPLKAQTPPTPVTHDFVIKLVDNVHALPTPLFSSQSMAVGDSVRFTCPDGSARVEIAQGTSFGPTVLSITDSNPHILATDGPFRWRCFVTPHGGTEVGWDPVKSPQSGGDGQVVPPRP